MRPKRCDVQARIWFDGAAKGNPGPAGAGAVLEMGGRRQVLRKRLGRATNNEAEYEGLIIGLEAAAAAGASRVEVRGDSQLIIKQLLGEYQVKAANLRPLYETARGLLAGFEDVRLQWIRRAENAAADQAANEAL